MTCARGHEREREFIAGRMRCRECHRENMRAQAKRRRDRKRDGVAATGPSSLTCPYCSLFPCRCELL